MGSRIVSSFEKFQKEFNGLADDAQNTERLEALKNYFKSGGVVSLSKKPSGWPKLVYPSPRKVEEHLKEAENLKSIFVKKHGDWEAKQRNAQIYFLKNEVLKLSEPLYWKHLGKMIFDRDYKEDARQVKLPANLIADKRWRPMIKTFVNDVEYRKQLVETVQHSIVYEKNKEVAVYAKELQDFRQNVSVKKIDQIKEKISELENQINTLKIIQKWAKE